MDKSLDQILTETDQNLHTLVHNIGEALKTLEGENKLQAEQLFDHLRKAHDFTHELAYMNKKQQTIRAVLITEHYDDERACTELVKYDNLPENVKKVVDKALTDEHKSCKVNAYSEGLQHLYQITYATEEQRVKYKAPYPRKEFFLEVGDKDIELLGDITFYTGDRS